MACLELRIVSFYRHSLRSWTRDHPSLKRWRLDRRLMFTASGRRSASLSSSIPGRQLIYIQLLTLLPNAVPGKGECYWRWVFRFATALNFAASSTSKTVLLHSQLLNFPCPFAFGQSFSRLPQSRDVKCSHQGRLHETAVVGRRIVLIVDPEDAGIHGLGKI